MTDLTKNPKLGIIIISNAYKIATSIKINGKKNNCIRKEDFIMALDQSNINMDNNTKEMIKERFRNLEEKTKQKLFLKYLKKRKQTIL